MTSQLPPAPAHRHGAHEPSHGGGHRAIAAGDAHAQGEHAQDEDAELDEVAELELDDDTEGADHEEPTRRDDDETVPRARLSGLGPGNDPGDHPKTPQPGTTKPKRRRRRGGRGRKHKGGGSEAALAKAIRKIYGQKHDGIIEAMIKSEAQQVKSTAVIDAIKSAVAATTAVLDAQVAILAKIFVEGVAALAKSWKQSADPYDFFAFCQDYLAALPDAKDAALKKAKTELRSDPSVLTAATTLAGQGTQVQNDQAAEIVSAWTNVLRSSGKDPGRAGGVGRNDSTGNPFDSAAAGRLHISGIRIEEDWRLNRGAAGVTLKDVPGKAAEFFRDRTLDSLPIARTLDFKQIRSTPIHGSFGVNQKGNTAGDKSDERSKTVFASYATRTMLDAANQAGEDDQSVIDAHWQEGIDKLWEAMKHHKVSEFDMHIGG